MKFMHSISAILVTVVMLVFSVPAHAAQNDSQIEKSVKNSYVFKTYLKNDNVKVQSKGGVVTLTGDVSEESHIKLVQDTVIGIPGVKNVENKLEVKGKSPAKFSDAWLVTKVKSTLLFHRSVSAGTEVDVKNGIVTLSGRADSQSQKDLTTEYVKGLEGVKDVKNEMTVSKSTKKKEKIGKKIDDASITAQVKMTLVSHSSTSAMNTKVETSNGVVTLSGKARTAAEIKLASKLAKDVNGVKEVKNMMTVE